MGIASVHPFASIRAGGRAGPRNDREEKMTMSTFPAHQKRVVGGGALSTRRIMHIDMDAYFAALEQKANPKLVGRPVVVGSPGDKRGVVSTASYESRVFGIHSGMSSREAKARCPDAVFVGVDPDHYTSVSAELLKIFNEFSPKVESVSVDEAFLDVTGCGEVFGSEEKLARELKDKIHNALGLTCSLGIAPTKIMAKLASSVFKPDGLTVLKHDDVASVLYPLPVEKMWGIGPVAAEALHNAGINTIGDLAQFDLKKLRSMLGKYGEVMGRIARGDEQTPVLSPDDQPDEKSIGHERTFESDSADPDFLHATLFYLADLVSRRMRRNGYIGRTITVRIRHADFTTVTRRTTLKHSTDSHAVIYHYASQIFDAYWNQSIRLRLLGISASGLDHVADYTLQQNMFHESGVSRESARTVVDVTIDQIRDRFGEHAIQAAFSHLRTTE